MAGESNATTASWPGRDLQLKNSSGYHVILEGILHTARYAQALRALIAEHAGPGFICYLDVSFEATVRRHANRPQATESNTLPAVPPSPVSLRLV